MTREEIKTKARKRLSECHWEVVGTIVIAGLIQGVATGLGCALGAGGLAVPILISPLTVGLDLYAVNKMRGGGETKDLFKPFSSYINSVLVMFLMRLFTFLWGLLLIIPGIIKAYEYWCVPYILADNADISYKEAFTRSREMTSGHKMDLFLLQLSFLGWDALGALTFGILEILYVAPYKQLAYAEMYNELSSEAY